MEAKKLDAKTILEKVKLFFTELNTPVAAAEPAPAPVEYETKDGKKVTIDKMEAGGVVMIDGNPAPVGDIELVDGTVIVIGDNGVIAEVKPIAAMPETEDMGAKFAEFQTATNEKFANYETKFAAYEQRFADYEVKLGKANQVIEQLMNLSQLLVEAPASNPDAAVTQTGNFKKDVSKEEKQKAAEDILFR